MNENAGHNTLHSKVNLFYLNLYEMSIVIAVPSYDTTPKLI